MRSKYRNKITKVGGHTFSSKKEAARYLELMELGRQGIVKWVILQPQFTLQKAFRKGGKHYRAIVYIADFQVGYADGRVEIEDVKGRFMTEVFRLKRRLFEFKYPDLTIKIVTKVKMDFKELR